MPHKQVRGRSNDFQNFDLPPSTLATALPTHKRTVSHTKSKQTKAAKSAKVKSAVKNSYGADDTPRAFARMMHAPSYKRPSSGLDEGEKPSKKSKKQHTDEDTMQDSTTRPEPRDVTAPKILPGERLSAFATRVNQALPISGLARKGNVRIDGVKNKQTRTEKRLHKLYAQWRAEEAKIKARNEELAEEAEEQEDEMAADHDGQDTQLPYGKRGRRKRAIGEIDEPDDDPWAVLKHKRDAPKGLHDVALAPPDLKVKPKEKFKVRNGAKIKVANVPTSAGSLKKREELSEARREVIERYRAMMKTSSR